MEKLPVDFEKKVKMAASPNGTGAPVQISAKDLMDNFNHLLDQVPDGSSGGDMLVWNGSEWYPLDAPSTTDSYILGSSSGYPSWVEPTAAVGIGSGGVLPASYGTGALLQGDGSGGWASTGGAPSAGDMTYFNAEGEWDFIPAGSTGAVLTMGADSAAWETPATLGTLPDSFSAGALLQGAGSGAWSSTPTAPATGEMAYFDGTNWVYIAAASGSGTFVLASVDGVIDWIATAECP